jgi:GNAT superfamily N-acetyltransferase
MPPIIRPARIEDAPAITDLLREIGWFHAVADVPLEQAQSVLERHLNLCLADSSHSVYVGLDEDGALLGFASVHWLPYLILAGPEGYVSELFLREAARGQGLGARLLETVLAEARERGCVRLSLMNNRERESYRRGFYEKHGWEERPLMANMVYWIK